MAAVETTTPRSTNSTLSATASPAGADMDAATRAENVTKAIITSYLFGSRTV